jgi:hypothetical protein
MVTALSPVLIMTLVGSLVYFLLGVFYQGQFETRLHFIMAMFVMAAVLIARISIEEGREYSMLFAFPLAGATIAATFRFVQFQGPLAGLSPLISVGLIALIWWSADRLTWDCTVIDESQDASGQGLLQTVGVEAEPSSGQTGPGQSSEADTLGTTLRADQARAEGPPAMGLWQRFVEHRRRPHSPGVWVVYFSLAALPIFGLGQWCVPAADVEGRRYVFNLLVIYVASALGLLLTTSFLGLRRYLRQRRLAMPGDMAVTWLVIGSAMIVAILLFCLLLPRRNPEYSVSQLPIFAGSPDNLRTSRWGFGNDGPNQEGADRLGAQQGEATSQQSSADGRDGGPSGSGDSQSQSQSGQSSQDSQSGPSSPSGQSAQSPSSSSSRTDSRTDRSSDDGSDRSQGDPTSAAKNDQLEGDPGKGQREGSSSGKSQRRNSAEADSRSTDSNAQRKSREKSGQSESDKRSERQTQQPTRQQADQQTEQQTEPRRQDREASNNRKQATDTERERQSEGNTREPAKPASSPGSQQSPSQWNPLKALSQVGASFGALLRLLYWLVAIAIIAYLLWRYREQVLLALRNFLRSLQELWQRLFGGGSSAVDESSAEAAVALPPRPFADYPDPFLTGEADRWPQDELLRYSFQAFEAWARERGYPRLPEQTPSEFVQGVAARERQLTREALQLAEIYNLFAYGRKASSPLNVAPVRRLWRMLREGTAA